MNKLKVLIVDDSVFIRQVLSKFLTTDDIEVIGVANNGLEGIQKAKVLNPDVITMDIEMPIMNGIQAVTTIMKEHPTPVLMFSSLTTDGADATLDALNAGAVDFIGKKSGLRELDSLRDEILDKVRTVGSNSEITNRLKRRRLLNQFSSHHDKVHNDYTINHSVTKFEKDNSRLKRRRPLSKNVRILAIGISTGGPVALQKIFRELPGDITAPIVIAQHMPSFFTKSLATRLNNLSQITVKEAEDGDILENGTAYIAQGGLHMKVTRGYRLQITDKPTDALFKPSVNVLLSSVAEVYGSYGVGLMMTGMGNDGAIGFKDLYNSGGYIMTQDIDSCVVSGMPKSIIEQGIVSEIVTLDKLSTEISSLFGLKPILI